MIIYKDIISDDELLTDAYKNTEVDGFFYKVEGKYVTRKGDGISDAMIGGNASAEATEEEATEDPNAVSGINVVLDNRLVETGFGSKKEYQKVMKDYMKRIIDKLTEQGRSDEVDGLKKAAAPAMKKVFDNFKEYQFFIGESMNPDAMHVLVEYEGAIPYLYFFKYGLVEEKV